MSIEVTIRGNVGDNIRINNGERKGEQYQVLNFTVASTKLKKEIVNGQETLVPEKTTWVNCSYWSKDADVVRRNLQKGLPVTVVGQLVNLSTYVSKQTGEILPSMDIRADTVYLNLNSKRIENITLAPPQFGKDADTAGFVFDPPPASVEYDQGYNSGKAAAQRGEPSNPQGSEEARAGYLAGYRAFSAVGNAGQTAGMFIPGGGTPDGEDAPPF